MRNPIDIFTQTHASHTSRHIAGFDSIVNSGSCAVGHIAGQYRSIPALVIDSVTQSDQWRIVNLKGHKGQEAQFDAIGVLGAVDDQQAIDLALMQFGRMFNAVAVDVLPTNTNGLMRHLNTRHYHMRQQMIQPWQLKSLQDVVCAEKPMWDDINLLSHKGQTANLMLDLQRHDDHDGLLSKFDGLPQLLENLEVQEPGFDALIVQYQHLERLTAQLHTAMRNAGKAGVQVTNVTVSKPFKRNKVAQVAVTYDLDDGQNVTILFHNPDSTPSRLAQSDTLISWKIQLNNRDVTGVIQPNQGEGIVLPVLAGRIMKLVNQNSARFKGHQSKKAERVQALTDAEQRLTDKTAQEQALDNEIKDLQQQIDAANEQAKHQQELAQQNGEALNGFMATIAESANLGEAPTKNYFFKEKVVDGTKYHLSVDPFAGGLTIALVVTPTDAEEQVTEQAFTLEQLQNGGVEDAKAYLQTLDTTFSQAESALTLAPEPNSSEPVFESDAKERAETLPEEQSRLATKFPILEKFIQVAKDRGYVANLGWGGASVVLNMAGSNPHLSVSLNVSPRLGLDTDEDVGKITIAFWQDEKSDYEYVEKFDATVANIIPAFEKAEEYVDSVQIPEPEPSTNPDIEFLQSIIDGRVEPATVDIDNMIELAERYQDDAAVNALVEQALNLINQAEQAAAQNLG